MSSSERQRREEEQLQQEIAELRGELGETVDPLVDKADLPTRAKERGAQLAEQAVDRGVQLAEQAVDRGVEAHQQITQRGAELGAQARHWYEKAKAQTNGQGSEWRDQLVSVTERARTALPERPAQARTALVLAGLALVATIAILRRARAS